MLLFEFENLVPGNVNYNDTLNPKLYDDSGNMHPEVHAALMAVAENFVTDIDLPDMVVHDIILTGSSANYNWTKYSDVDLHLISDVDVFADPHMATKYFGAAKNVWNNNHDVDIRGLDVEVYVEDNDESHQSLGRFSVMNNEWISKPVHNKPVFDEDAVNRKVRYIMAEIDALMQDDDAVEDIEHLKKKIWLMRGEGLHRKVAGGEYSVENLAFKILRNMGYLDKIREALDNAEDRELSVENMRFNEIEEGFQDQDTYVKFFKPVAVQAVNMMNRAFEKNGVNERAFLVDKHTITIDGSLAGISVDITDSIMDDLGGGKYVDSSDAELTDQDYDEYKGSRP